MKVLILGGGGMVGQKTARRLAADHSAGNIKIDEMILHDIIAPKPIDVPFKLTCLTGNVADASQSERLAGLKPDVIFHLAAIVSGEAEKEFEKGWDVNARGSWHLLEAIRAIGGGYRPRVIFTSSIAVFGAPYPEAIDDEFLCAPMTSYGAQKAMTELLIGDYSRKGFIDGLSIRLPTICVRPGKANLAASSFFSGIIREPLNGIEAILPVDDSVRHWHASPRSAAGFMSHALQLDFEVLGSRRALNLPGVSCTVAEQIEALRSVCGEEPVKLIKHQPDEAIVSIVDGWPRNFEPVRAIELGFVSESSFEEIIKVYLEDDFEG